MLLGFVVFCVRCCGAVLVLVVLVVVLVVVFLSLKEPTPLHSNESPTL